MNARFSRFWVGLLSLACLTNLAVDCDAQTGGNVTVQLPTFHQFGVSTTVLVPDRGSIYLGGVNRSGLGRNRFGSPLPGFGNRGLGRTSSAGGMSISATIIDHNEIDRALLAEAARRRGARVDIHGRPVAGAPEGLPAVVVDRAARARDGRNSLAPPRYRNFSDSRSASKSVAESRRAKTYLERGRRAEAEGQPYVAKVFYQRVIKHGNRALKQQAEARLAHIETATRPILSATPNN